MKFLEAGKTGHRLALVHPTPFNILGHPDVLQSDLRRHELLDDSSTREIVGQGTKSGIHRVWNGIIRHVVFQLIPTVACQFNFHGLTRLG